MTTTTTAPPTTWTETQISEIVIELLGDLLDTGPAELRAELEAKGSAMPVDSLDLFDVLVEFRQRTGLKIPKRKLRRDTMRSVKAFAEFAAREGTI
ncbi:MAG: acyl carrier protein [Solirubrobacterales bacterium]